MNDSELLGRFARASDEAAFAEVVRRYVDLVYGAALRQTGGDRHLAEDITQQVFITLARKVASLTQHPTIVGWLYSTVRLTALGVARRERRRSHHERASAVTLAAAGSEPEWDRVRPVIDEAMQDLDEIDRESVLLRFFGQQNFATIAARLGISENAAQKRVERALDRLGGALARRGVTSTSTALALVLTHTVVAAPAPLAKAIAAQVGAAAIGGGAGTLFGPAWLKLGALGAVAAAVAIVTWEATRSPVLLAAEVVENRPVPEAKQERVVTTTPSVAPRPEMTTESPTPSSPPPVVRRWYTVGVGESGRQIATRLGVTLEALQAANSTYDFSLMIVGDQIVVPPEGAAPGGVSSPRALSVAGYMVKPGDTVAGIAAQTGLTLQQLTELNPDVDWRRLRVGQELRTE